MIAFPDLGNGIPSKEALFFFFSLGGKKGIIYVTSKFSKSPVGKIFLSYPRHEGSLLSWLCVWHCGPGVTARRALCRDPPQTWSNHGVALGAQRDGSSIPRGLEGPRTSPQCRIWGRDPCMCPLV